MAYYLMMKAFVLLTIIFLLACTHESSEVARYDLFSLRIGVMEDELNLFETRETTVRSNLLFTMRNGFFYLSNTTSGKIMRFSSYGDILSLIYNENTNPPFLQAGDQRLITRWNFNEQGQIAVNSDGLIYVVDRYSITQDFNLNFNEDTFYNYVVLIFNERGEYLNFLGREGFMGSSFPLVDNLIVTANNDIVVISRTLAGWQIFWFNSEGELLYQLNDLSPQSLLGPEAANFHIDNIIVSRTQPLLYIRTSAISSLNYPFSDYVYSYDLRTDSVSGQIVSPATGGSFYELIGSDLAGNLYFISTFGLNTNYNLLIIDSLDGSELHNLDLEAGFAREATFRLLSLDDSGILSAIFGNIRGANVLWWRLDRLFNTEHTLLGEDNFTLDDNLNELEAIYLEE